MLVEYITTKSKRNVIDSVGKTLIARGIARAITPTEPVRAALNPAAPLKSSPAVEPVRASLEPEPEPEPEAPLSPRTGKPTRTYNRRDLTAEE